LGKKSARISFSSVLLIATGLMGGPALAGDELTKLRFRLIRSFWSEWLSSKAGDAGHAWAPGLTELRVRLKIGRKPG